MVTWVLRCKLYPGATPWRDNRFARPSRGGGLIPRATAGLDRWLSRQNPAYRPALPKSTPSYRWGAFCVIHSLLFTIHMPCSKYRGIYNRGSRGRPLAAPFFCTEINACRCEPARTLAWPLPGIPPGHNPFSLGSHYGGAVTK